MIKNKIPIYYIYFFIIIVLIIIAKHNIFTFIRILSFDSILLINVKYILIYLYRKNI